MEYYHGWTNYVTWCTYTWITNDQDTFLIAAACPTEEDLKRFCESLCHTMEEASLEADLLGYALCLVNWGELFEAFKE